MTTAHGQFNCIRQAVPMCTHLIDPPHPAFEAASWSPFLHSSWQGVPILYNVLLFSRHNCPFAVMESRDTYLVLRHGFSSLCLDTCMSCLGFASSLHVSSCLCLMTMSLSDIAKCLFCAKTLAILAESKYRYATRPIYSLFTCLL